MHSKHCKLSWKSSDKELPGALPSSIKMQDLVWHQQLCRWTAVPGEATTAGVLGHPKPRMSESVRCYANDAVA